MYIKVTNDQIQSNYSIDDLKRDNPNISFPENISDQILADFGVFRCIELASPDYNSRTHRLVTQQPTLVDGVWTVSRIAVQKDQAQIDLENTQKEKSIRDQRNRLLSETDWRFRSDMNPSQEWKDYCQALRDVPSQDGFPWTIIWPTQP